MSVDRTLHMKSGMTSKRNVLKRDERLVILSDEGRWEEQQGVMGLPKTRVRHSKAGAKAKKEEATVAEGATATAAEGAKAAPAAPAAKGAKGAPAGKSK